MVNVWEKINDTFYIAGECMMSVFPKTMKEQIIHRVIYRGPSLLAWVQVRHETVVVEAGQQHGETPVADLCVRGIWLRYYLLLIVTPSHICVIHLAGPREFLMLKLRKIINMQMSVSAHFTPLCFLLKLCEY